jgi:hypothetical protein
MTKITTTIQDMDVDQKLPPQTVIAKTPTLPLTNTSVQNLEESFNEHRTVGIGLRVLSLIVQ